MKRLTGEDAIRIDSSKETLDKWYKFIRKSAENVGYGPNVYNNIHPYLEKGFKVPSVNEQINLDKSGRAFFRRSVSDKMLTYVCLNTPRNNSIIHENIITVYFELVAQWLYQQHQNDKTIPEIPNINMAELSTYMLKHTNASVRSMLIDEPIFIKAIFNILYTAKVKIRNNDKILDCTDTWIAILDELYKHYNYIISNNTNTEAIEKLIENIKTNSSQYDFDDYRLKTPINSANSYIIDIEYLDNIYGNIEIFNENNNNHLTSFTKNLPSITNTNQVINEEYMVLSLNPIDKLMASTKQAYGSCLSLCYEGSNEGATGLHLRQGTGLYALMPSDEVYMIFYCNGKHKNMYWEKAQWQAAPENRDKEKAYKYFKYTVRQFGYNATIDKEIPKETDNPNVDIKFYEPRILPGRTYSVSGELIPLEFINSYLLHKAGIRTGYTSLEWNSKYEQQGIHLNFSKQSLLNKGYLLKNKICYFDRYGFKRGMYFDNVILCDCITHSASDIIASKYSAVTTGHGRCGSYNVTSIQCSQEVNAFDLMNGKISYTKFNPEVKICKDCGKIINPNNKDSYSKTGDEYVCSECLESQNYKYCEYCNTWYLPEEADQHTVVRLVDYLPLITEVAEKDPKVCIKQLKDIEFSETNFSYNSWGWSKYKKHICAFCGKVEHDSTYLSDYADAQRSYTSLMIAGITVKVRLCSSCISKAVICDVCGKIHILDENSTEPIILMPNKRVVCMDCAEKIRLKKAKKNKLLEQIQAIKETPKEDLENLKDTTSTNASSIYTEQNIKDIINNTGVSSERSLYSATKRKLIKGIDRQIQSLTCAGRSGYPKIRV